MHISFESAPLPSQEPSALLHVFFNESYMVENFFLVESTVFHLNFFSETRAGADWIGLVEVTQALIPCLYYYAPKVASYWRKNHMVQVMKDFSIFIFKILQPLPVITCDMCQIWLSNKRHRWACWVTAKQYRSKWRWFRFWVHNTFSFLNCFLLIKVLPYRSIKDVIVAN